MARDTCGIEETYTQGVSEEIDYLEDPGIEGRVILDYQLKGIGWVWPVFMWLRIGTNIHLKL